MQIQQIQRLDKRIKELCDKVAVAQGPDIETLLDELQAALREHAQYVHYMALKASSRSPKNTSSSKAAD